MSPQRQRARYARRSVWYLVAILSIVVVIGFAAAGYEINHQRNEINGLHNQVLQLNETAALEKAALQQLEAKVNPTASQTPRESPDRETLKTALDQ